MTGSGQGDVEIDQLWLFRTMKVRTHLAVVESW
jgi:hypothetical protein